MRRLMIIGLVILMCSCKNNEIGLPEKPDNLIAKDQMVEVLYDMVLISSAKGVNRRVLENKGIDPEQFVYERHGIDSAQFAESNAYYSYDIAGYKALYEEVKLKLEGDKKDFQDVLEDQKRKRDSAVIASKKPDSLKKMINRQKREITRNKKINSDRLSKKDTSLQ